MSEPCQACGNRAQHSLCDECMADDEKLLTDAKAEIEKLKREIKIAYRRGERNMQLRAQDVAVDYVTNDYEEPGGRIAELIAEIELPPYEEATRCAADERDFK